MGFTRTELEDMPRVKLQAICKGIGFKANESTSKIIENILTYEADNAAHRSRAVKPPTPPPAPDVSSRRVTRGSESSKTQESKSTRRTSSRLTSNPLRSGSNANQHRKSKVTQISLGVGRPKEVGGSGARVVTRNSVASGRSRKESRRGKQRLAEQDIPEDDEPVPSKRGAPEPEPSGTVVVTGLPPTPAATPNLVSTSHDTIQREFDEARLPGTTEFAPFHNLQSEMRELSSQYRNLQEQLKQVATLQSEVRMLRSMVDKQAGELEILRQEHQTCTSLKDEISTLMQEVRRLRQTAQQENEAAQRNAPIQAIEPRSPGVAAQVLGKRARDSPKLPSFHFAPNLPLGKEPVPDAISLSSLPPPKKKQRIMNDDHSNDDQVNMQSPFRLTSRDERTLADKLPGVGIDMATLFNLNATSTPAPGASNGESAPVQESERMLGVPPPGFTADFLTHPTIPLPFSLTPSGPSGSTMPENTTNTQIRQISRKITHGRLNPYKRNTSNTTSSRLRVPSNNDPFGFLGSDLLSANMHSANYPEQSSVAVNPAQLIAQGIPDPDKTPAAARTLYGTELEGDTRFGEFGIDGLTKSFWRAPGFPFK